MPPSSITELSMHHLPDLSLRHLPDLSDVSFQIPLGTDTDDLLAEPSNDFLADDDSLNTPMAPRKTHNILRLSDLTPRPDRFELSPSPGHAAMENPAIQTVSRPSQCQAKSSETREVSASAPRPTTQGQVEIHSNNHKSAPNGLKQTRVEPPIKNHAVNRQGPTYHSRGHGDDAIKGKRTGMNRKEERAASTEITLVSTSVAKSDASYQLNAAHRDVLDEHEAEAPGHSETMNVAANAGNLDASLADVTMDSCLGGAAERLLMYSGSIAQTAATGDERQSSSAASASSLARGEPLTVSQLSPRKVEPRPLQEPISPMRMSNKRPASPQSALDSSELRKREKRTHSAKPQPQSKTASLKSSRNKIRRPKAPRDRNASNEKENTPAPVSHKEHTFDVHQTHGPSGRKVDNQVHKEENVPGISHFPVTDKPNNHLPPPKPTAPIEFQFKSELRLQSRKAQHEERSRSTLKRSANRYANPIPDFKALHAAQEASLAARKEHIGRIVPPPLELNTEIRAKEREKFEEARRAREQEIERQMEERRRQKELEEEKEIRELRKRAIPKANAIPDWYADAPKKKGGQC